MADRPARLRLDGVPVAGYVDAGRAWAEGS